MYDNAKENGSTSTGNTQQFGSVIYEIRFTCRVSSGILSVMGSCEDFRRRGHQDRYVLTDELLEIGP